MNTRPDNDNIIPVDFSQEDLPSTFEGLDDVVTGAVIADGKPFKKATGGKPPLASYLKNPIVIGVQGVMNSIPLHQHRGLTVDRVRDLLRGDFYFTPLVEVDGKWYGMAYGAFPDTNPAPNIVASLIVGQAVVEKAILVSEDHISFQTFVDCSQETEKKAYGMETEERKQYTQWLRNGIHSLITQVGFEIVAQELPDEAITIYLGE